jgi:myo-inositol-1(or 4)-monophosphatase
MSLMLTSPSLQNTLSCVAAAGDIAMSYFHQGAPTHAHIEMKEGGSPVSAADTETNAFLHHHLSALWPNAAWLSEESVDDPIRLTSKDVLIVDPIDGTRAFIRGDPQWVISIAMVSEGAPQWGILHAPALNETFIGIHGQGAFCNNAPIKVSTHPELSQSRISGPKPILHRLSEQHIDFKTEPKIPSLAYRMAKVAKGQIEAGLSSTNPHDWDIAAVDIILREAGGILSDLWGRQLIYNLPFPQHGVVVGATAHLHRELTMRLKMAHEFP